MCVTTLQCSMNTALHWQNPSAQEVHACNCSSAQLPGPSSPNTHRASDWHNLPRNPGLPWTWTSATSTHHHIEIWDLKQRFFTLISAAGKTNVKTPRSWIHRQSHRALWGHTVTVGDIEAKSHGPWCWPWAFMFPPSFTSPLVNLCPEHTRIPTPILSVKLIQDQTKTEKINEEKKKKKTNQTHTSNIGLYLQKQPAIFGATAFKSSAWDILSAISMKAEHSQLPWKSASEVGAQYLSKPWRCFCKGKMLKLNHLQLRGTTQF